MEAARNIADLGTALRRNSGPVAVAAMAAVAVVAAAALAILGGATGVEAHSPSTEAHDRFGQYNITVGILGYERTAYEDFDLVRMTLLVKNLEYYAMASPYFMLGGPPQYVDDPVDNPQTAIRHEYGHSTYVDVRVRGGDVTVEECDSVDRFDEIAPGGTGETSICFIIGKAFQPASLYMRSDPLRVDYIFRNNHGDCTSRHGIGEHGIRNAYKPHGCYTHDVQVVPFHADADYCFDRYANWCNGDNVQSIIGRAIPAPTPAPTPTPAPEPTPAPTPTPAPEPDPAQPEPDPAQPEPTGALLYTMYNNHTGTLTLVFDSMVVARSPDRILLIHDINAYIDDRDAPSLGDSELHTVDGKRQSAVLSFALDDALRLAVTESLQTHGDLALLIDARSIYLADSLADVTDGSPVLVADIIVLR